MYNMYMYKQNLALNDQSELIHHKTQPTCTLWPRIKMLLSSIFVDQLCKTKSLHVCLII